MQRHPSTRCMPAAGHARRCRCRFLSRVHARRHRRVLKCRAGRHWPCQPSKQRRRRAGAGTTGGEVKIPRNSPKCPKMPRSGARLGPHCLETWSCRWRRGAAWGVDSSLGGGGLRRACGCDHPPGQQQRRRARVWCPAGRHSCGAAASASASLHGAHSSWLVQGQGTPAVPLPHASGRSGGARAAAAGHAGRRRPNSPAPPARPRCSPHPRALS